MPSKPQGKIQDLAKARKAKGVLLPDLHAVALKTSGGGHPNGDDCIHPSEMAKSTWCHRATYYRISSGKLVEEEHASYQMEYIFDEGNWSHLKWQHRMRQTGKLWGDWQCLICKQWQRQCFEPSIMEPIRCLVAGITHIWEYKEVHLSHGKVIGHEDGAMCVPDPFSGYLVEVKTLSSGTVRLDNPELLRLYYKQLADENRKIYDYDKLWADLARPFPTHVRQSNVYLWLAREMGLPFDRVRLLYEWKASQGTKEFTVTLSERIMKPLLAGVRAVEYALEHGEPPVCPHGGCKQCQAYEEMTGAYTPKERSGDAVVTGRRKPGATNGAGVQSRAASRRRGDSPGWPVPGEGVVSRRRRVEGAGDQPDSVGEASGGDAARVTGRRNRADRPAADAAVHRPVAVDEVSQRPGGDSPGGRVIRRKRPRQG